MCHLNEFFNHFCIGNGLIAIFIKGFFKFIGMIFTALKEIMVATNSGLEEVNKNLKDYNENKEAEKLRKELDELNKKDNEARMKAEKYLEMLGDSHKTESRSKTEN